MAVVEMAVVGTEEEVTAEVGMVAAARVVEGMEEEATAAEAMAAEAMAEADLEVPVVDELVAGRGALAGSGVEVKAEEATAEEVTEAEAMEVAPPVQEMEERGEAGGMVAEAEWVAVE
ncbi:hypothetical protein AB1Y20_003487 [Prymnesium parvum]|uniref:Uncharacterized protein n=1 Tax=Prymnesium parvum TaxID=97485 RepID=A0AB34JD36_PRYPA